MQVWCHNVHMLACVPRVISPELFIIITCTYAGQVGEEYHVISFPICLFVAHEMSNGNHEIQSA